MNDDVSKVSLCQCLEKTHDREDGEAGPQAKCGYFGCNCALLSKLMGDRGWCIRRCGWQSDIKNKAGSADGMNVP